MIVVPTRDEGCLVFYVATKYRLKKLTSANKGTTSSSSELPNRCINLEVSLSSIRYESHSFPIKVSVPRQPGLAAVPPTLAKLFGLVKIINTFDIVNIIMIQKRLLLFIMYSVMFF